MVAASKKLAGPSHLATAAQPVQADRQRRPPAATDDGSWPAPDCRPPAQWSSRTLSVGGGATVAPTGMKGFHSPMESSTAASPPVGSPEPRRPGSRAVLTLVNGVLAGVGGVFVATHACPST